MWWSATLGEGSRSQRLCSIGIHVYVMSGKGTSIGTENRSVVGWGWGWEWG